MRNKRGLRPPRVILVIALITAAVATTAAFVSVSWGSTNSSDSPLAHHASGQLTLAINADATALDPPTATDWRDWQLFGLVYETLVTVDDNFKAIPELATSWKQTSPTTYVFNIRQGVKFSNGRELTTDDVVGSLQRLVDPKTGSYWAAQMGNVTSVTSNAPWQVTVTLAQPRASFLVSLAHSSASILPMKELQAGSYDPSKQLLGTGPYQVASHSANESWTLTRNPYFRKAGVPKAGTLIIRVIPDQSAQVAALRSGTADIALFESPDSIRLLKGQPNVTTVVQKTTDYYRLDVNGITSILRDQRLRQALALSLDRNQIIKLALNGVGRPTAASPATLPNSCSASAVPFASPNIAKARRLVAAARAKGKPVTIMVPTGNPTQLLIAQIVQRELVQVGLKAKIQQYEIGEWVKRLITDPKAPFDISVYAFAGYADPAMVLAWWNPYSAQWNKHWLRPDKQLIRLVAASLGTAPGKKRQQVLQETCNRIASDANIIPIATKVTVVAYRSDRVSARIQPTEGYGEYVRYLPEFSGK